MFTFYRCLYTSQHLPTYVFGVNCVHDLITLLNATFSRNLSQALLRSADVDSTHFSLALALASETSFIKPFDLMEE